MAQLMSQDLTTRINAAEENLNTCFHDHHRSCPIPTLDNIPALLDSYIIPNWRLATPNNLYVHSLILDQLYFGKITPTVKNDLLRNINMTQAKFQALTQEEVNSAIIERHTHSYFVHSTHELQLLIKELPAYANISAVNFVRPIEGLEPNNSTPARTILQHCRMVNISHHLAAWPMIFSYTHSMIELFFIKTQNMGR